MVLLGLFWLSIAITEAVFFSLTAEDLGKIIHGKSLWEKALITLVNYPRHIQITNAFLRIVVKLCIATGVVFFATERTFTWGWLVLSILCVSLLVLFGDNIAKALAARHRLNILRWTAPLLRILTFTFMPLSFPLLALQDLFVKILGQRSKASEKAASRILHETLNEVLGKADDNEMLKTLTSFGSVSVRQLMKPRKDITAVEIKKDFAELIELINLSGYSRIPAYRSTLDSVEGMIYIKDLIPFIDQQKGFEWQKLIRPVFLVSETTRLSVLLKDFQQKHVHIALVVDKYGRIAGLITLHDLIEEVIDDINEEINPVNPGA